MQPVQGNGARVNKNISSKIVKISISKGAGDVQSMRQARQLFGRHFAREASKKFLKQTTWCGRVVIFLISFGTPFGRCRVKNADLKLQG